MENKAHHEPRKLSYQFLKQITNDFHEVLGRGTFGVVYKGVYENGVEIAVKILHNSLSGLDVRFHKEFDNVRGRKHPNIVELVGYCNEVEEVLVEFEGKQVTATRMHNALCFEHVHNGSLQKFISDENTGFNWGTRYRIIKGLCEGLKYLHEGSEYPIMHLDLKVGNVLLDKNMVPKIADFDASELIGEENAQRMLSTIGTIGYWPPEYIRHQIISKEFDIFSLGVIIVKIMMGVEDYNSFVEMTTQKCVKLVHERWRKKLHETLSHTSLEVYCNQVEICIRIALRCLKINRLERPNIHDIVSSLNKTETMIRDQELLIEKFHQGEASSSTIAKNYLSAQEPEAMTFQDLVYMTDNFSKERLLGNGGYGVVYKGVRDNGEEIAVKKLHYQPGLDDGQFKNELLNLMRVQHQNIIGLVGYCSEAREKIVQHNGKLCVAGIEERALCLEYMPGGTLDVLISDELCGLDWKARYKIINGICQGLKYLHTGTKDPIYHMDLKPANILLDKDMIPKIGDFGLSRLLGPTRTCVITTALGTLGYMPPEYIERQEISAKSDVYSLGVIILQVIAGRENYYKSPYMPSQAFIELVTENWSKRVQEETMSTEALLEVQKCIKIALRCVETNRENRPTITEIVEEMNMIDLHPVPFRADPGDETTPAALSNSLADLVITDKEQDIAVPNCE